MDNTLCICCGGSRTKELIRIERLPVVCNELHGTAASARSAMMGPLALRFCEACGHYYNAAFDPERIEYTPAYDASLYASDVFREYAAGVATRLIARYNIRGKRAVEIGCGQGEFLRILCREGANICTGFDPATPTEKEDPLVPGVWYIRDYFSAVYEAIRADLIVCQQVLEHVPNPKDFLANLRATKTFSDGNPVIYFEVPNGHYTFKDLGIWDLIYEHVSYFTQSSLRHLFESAGFEILDIGTAYGEQYLFVEARATEAEPGAMPMGPPPEDKAIADAFADKFSGKIKDVRGWTSRTCTGGIATYVWGAGSKGITFCNLVDGERRIAGLIDRNAKKRGKHIPGSGTRIYRLEDLPAENVSKIVVMNPQYLDEIARDLRLAGIDAELIPV